MHIMNTTEYTREPIFGLSAVQIFNLFSAILGSSLVDRLGRRTLFIVSNTGMLISKSWNTRSREFVCTKIDLS